MSNTGRPDLDIPIPFTLSANGAGVAFVVTAVITQLHGYIKDATRQLAGLDLDDPESRKTLPDIIHAITQNLRYVSKKLANAPRSGEGTDDDIHKLRIALAQYTALGDIAAHIHHKDIHAMSIDQWSKLQKEEGDLNEIKNSILNNLKHFMARDWATLRTRLEPVGQDESYLPIYLEANYFLLQYLSDQCDAAPDLVPADIKSGVATYRSRTIDQYATEKLEGLQVLSDKKDLTQEQYDAQMFPVLELLASFMDLTHDCRPLIGEPHHLWPILSQILTCYDTTLNTIEHDSRTFLKRLAKSVLPEEATGDTTGDLTLLLNIPHPEEVRNQLSPEQYRIQTLCETLHGLFPDNQDGIKTAMPSLYAYATILGDAIAVLSPAPDLVTFNGLAIFEATPSEGQPLPLPTKKERLGKFFSELQHMYDNAKEMVSSDQDNFHLLALRYKDTFVTPCEDAQAFVKIIESFLQEDNLSEEESARYAQQQGYLNKFIEFMAPLTTKADTILENNGFEKDPDSPTGWTSPVHLSKSWWKTSFDALLRASDHYPAAPSP